MPGNIIRSLAESVGLALRDLFGHPQAPSQQRPSPQERTRMSGASRGERIDLPFREGHRTLVDRIYENRRGIAVTVLCYSLFCALFISARFIISPQQAASTIYLDMQELEELQEQLERAQELNRYLNSQDQMGEYERILNRISNQNADFSSEDALINRNGGMEELYSQASAVAGRTAANRARFEQGLAEERAMMESGAGGRSQEQPTQAATGSVKGRVTVSYSLMNPLRNVTYLYNPAYRCEGRGSVTVTITVNQNGDVIDASIDAASSSQDYCMTTTALDAARRTRFDVNTSAPQRQTGTITYEFIPQ